MIVSSFQAQYGLRLSRELKTMKWSEFRDLLVGIGPETALGRIVSIRAEDNKERLKHFTKEQRRIRSEWRRKRAKQKTPQQAADFYEEMKQAFIHMAGGVKN